MRGMTREDVISLVLRRRRQFLVHSFLYYVINSSIIEDHMYDRICKELVELQEKYPNFCANVDYHDICMQLTDAGSGFYIKNYPDGIVTTAFHLLASETGERFSELVFRHGFRVLSQNGGRL